MKGTKGNYASWDPPNILLWFLDFTKQPIEYLSYRMAGVSREGVHSQPWADDRPSMACCI